MKRTLDALNKLGACQDAKDWLASLPPKTSNARAWHMCKRGDWMLWILGTQAGPPESEGRKTLVACCCEVARQALPHAKSPAVLTCIETAERWTRGEATIDEVRKARAAAAADAYAAADAAAAAYAVSAAAYAAADAAYAAYAVSAAADAAAADAAAAAAAAADDAADAAAARSRSWALSADIVRKHYPKPPVLP